ncbi:hypothetical protein K440DRAFT_523789, partial [Wilcoxina mikolae CBS 423.85]
RVESYGNYLVVTGTALGDSGDDFMNNLFSDLAPLLALFGEQFAKQFMSESMGWLDHVIFAMAPLGIITAIVGAIRVGGPSWLRAVIGRARENRAAPEVELMSSTSHEVCELWNGQVVVRMVGRPEVQQLVYLQDCKDGLGIYTMSEAEKEGYLERKQAPNISLNLHGGSKVEDLYAVAACGIVLQFGVLAFSGLAVYYPGWNLRFPKNGRPIQSYAYPLMATGTVLLVIGMIICSWVIEQSTTEEKWVVKGLKPKAHLLWLQKSHTVSDQSFESFVIFAQGTRDAILSSRRAPNDHKKTLAPRPQNGDQFTWGSMLEKIASNRSESFTFLGTLLSLAGFVAQFQGFRGLHWAASISQLVAIFAMTMFRAWVRRGLIARPIAEEVLDGCEMDWLA